MKVHISARVDEDLAHFLDSYRERHSLKSRSEALERAIEALRDRALEAQYELAMEEWSSQDESVLQAWDALASDGLEPDSEW